MSFPSFFAPAAAWLFLLAIPLIIFYFLKLRRPRTQVPSLALWQQVINDRRVNSPFQKFKRNLLLLLQLLVLLLVVFAAMQPFSQGAVDRAQYQPVLIDCSASMAARGEKDGKSRLDVARERVEELIDNLLPDQRLMLISFDSTAHRLTEFTDNKRVLRDALAKLKVADVPSRTEDALRMTQALALSTRPPFQKVLMYSDGNFPAETDFDLPFELVYQRLPAAGPNIGITGLNARRTGDKSWAVFVRVEGSASAKNAAAVVLLRGGSEIGRENVFVEAKKPQQLVFQLDVAASSSLEVRLEPEGFDSLASDNVAFLDLPAPRALTVYVSPTLSTYRRALNVLDGVELSPDDKGAGSLNSYDLAINDGSDKSTPDAKVTLRVGEVADDLKKLVSVSGEGSTIVDWQRNSPLLRHVELTEITIADKPKSAANVQDQDFEQLGYAVVAHGRDGPLILRKRERGKLTYHLLFHTDRSSLPYRIGFSILVQNLVQIARQQASLAEVAGERTGVLPARNLQPEQTYRVALPGGGETTAKSNPQAILAGIPAPTVGRYAISTGGEASASIGVSLLDAAETKLTAVDEIRFRESTVTADETAVPTDKPFWYVLAVIGFFVLLLEWWYFQRRRGRTTG